ncbi:MAG: DUF4249 domain-containing protein [Flavobacteriaceae bacterium]|nr:DUF4249 domain-containing protein [Flavobacteriaceae bacterium]
MKQIKSLIKNLFFAVALVFILYSCEKTIDFESKYIQPQIVVNSIVRPGRGVLVEVGKSRSILDENNYFEAITGAKVLLYENGAFLTELQYMSRIDTFQKYLNDGIVEKYPYEKGNYIDTIVVLKAGATYRLEVSKEGFNPVSCETTVPVPISMLNSPFILVDGVCVSTYTAVPIALLCKILICIPIGVLVINASLASLTTAW